MFSFTDHLAKVLLPLPNLHTPTSNRSERNLVNAPHLLSFFLNFVLRNRVLPKVSHEHGIRNALDIVELAKKELPLTYKIGRALPNVLSTLKEHGRQTRQGEGPHAPSPQPPLDLTPSLAKAPPPPNLTSGLVLSSERAADAGEMLYPPTKNSTFSKSSIPVLSPPKLVPFKISKPKKKTCTHKRTGSLMDEVAKLRRTVHEMQQTIQSAVAQGAGLGLGLGFNWEGVIQDKFYGQYFEDPGCIWCEESQCQFERVQRIGRKCDSEY
ncbi:uncharacterized protein F5891DRAFT_1206908 [Suillus fuscotomentosus]|uniref:Uncharacterized protein n=1 Tax=Suillus fuscotomentosus TaxID=1912939 RepID=A0AAD4HNG9_9AGAM|nr:uncharacterized protein F5891DRAFT_1206908 [Suillus fuscotomentosus]KAG1904215.1 hypothetical protein F5891DRAFT_1206908 [Suillus fuscotomentosus]